VLATVPPSEREAAQAAVERAADAVECAVRDGFEQAMARFNS
jgi:peptidyl-tRNA hydrolase